MLSSIYRKYFILVIQEATVIILDVGSNMSEPVEEGQKKTALDLSVQCITRMLQNKVLVQKVHFFFSNLLFPFDAIIIPTALVFNFLLSSYLFLAFQRIQGWVRAGLAGLHGDGKPAERTLRGQLL